MCSSDLGDDDSTPEGDTDHSHWAPDGTQLKPVPGKPMTDPESGELQYAKAVPDIRDATEDDPPTAGAGESSQDHTGFLKLTEEMFANIRAALEERQ